VSLITVFFINVFECSALLTFEISAGAKFGEEIPASDRPTTAPLRQRSAQRREMLVKAGRAKAPTGFSYAIRIVFEHMDPQGKGEHFFYSLLLASFSLFILPSPLS
jgi:hypothetical protein